MNPLLALRDEKTHMARDYDSHPLDLTRKKNQMLFPPYLKPYRLYLINRTVFRYSHKRPKASVKNYYSLKGMRNTLRKRGTFIIVKIS